MLNILASKVEKFSSLAPAVLAKSNTVTRGTPKNGIKARGERVRCRCEADFTSNNVFYPF